MFNLVLQHDADTGRFLVIRRHDCKLLGSVELPDPRRFKAANTRKPINLVDELSWYANSFLRQERPDVRRADRLLRCLKEWGEAAFLTILRQKEIA